jgi:hypothetical protein
MSEYVDLKTHMTMWNSPIVNVFSETSSQKHYGPFFFSDETVTGMT